MTKTWVLKGVADLVTSMAKLADPGARPSSPGGTKESSDAVGDDGGGWWVHVVAPPEAVCGGQRMEWILPGNRLRDWCDETRRATKRDARRNETRDETRRATNQRAFPLLARPSSKHATNDDGRRATSTVTAAVTTR